MEIFVSRLHYQAREAKLRELFSQFGTVTSTEAIIDLKTGRSKGFGFVEMPNEDEALAAIEALHNSELYGKCLVVCKARPRVAVPV
ncbi:UNVERIFIED_CONTAM: hypothetical protein GTU68_026499 [Idotea baltica]|nr:hypothetical protein [Idotea baltica]